MRVEQIGDCTLYLANMWDLVKDEKLQFDALATDPPYGIGESNKNFASRSKLANADKYKPKDWDDKKPTPIEINTLRKMTKYQIIFGGNYFELPPTKCWLVWDKENGANDFADAELAWTNFDMAVRLIRYRWAGMLQKNMGDKKEERVHPTQKPVGVMEWCLSHLPSSVETVFDPYMGSGTTGVACVKMGRKFIGIEREPEYFEIAIKRIREAYAQPDLFVAPPTPMKQEVMI